MWLALFVRVNTALGKRLSWMLVSLTLPWHFASILHSSLRRLCSWQHHRGGDNHHARILLPTFAIQFLIAEARGLSFWVSRTLWVSAHSILCSASLGLAPDLFSSQCAFVPQLFPQSCTRTPVLKSDESCFASSSALFVVKETNPAELLPISN